MLYREKVCKSATGRRRFSRWYRGRFLRAVTVRYFQISENMVLCRYAEYLHHPIYRNALIRFIEYDSVAAHPMSVRLIWQMFNDVVSAIVDVPKSHVVWIAWCIALKDTLMINKRSWMSCFGGRSRISFGRKILSRELDNWYVKWSKTVEERITILFCSWGWELSVVFSASVLSK